MPVVQVSYAPSRELYDEVGKHLDLADDRPAGLIIHAANELPDGRVQIVDVYESAADVEAFGPRIMRAFQAAGVPEHIVMASRPTAHQAFDLMR